MANVKADKGRSVNDGRNTTRPATGGPIKAKNSGGWSGHPRSGKNVNSSAPAQVGTPANGSVGTAAGRPTPATTAHAKTGGASNPAGRSVNAPPSAGWTGSGAKKGGPRTSAEGVVKHPARKNGINAQNREYAQNV
jgi:hypothetical protein